MTTGWSLFVIILTVAQHPGLPVAAALDLEAAHGQREDRRRRRHGPRLGRRPARVQQPAAALVAVAVLHHGRLRPDLPRALSGTRQLRRRQGLDPVGAVRSRKEPPGSAGRRSCSRRLPRCRSPSSRTTSRRCRRRTTCSSTTARSATARTAAAPRLPEPAPTPTGSGAATPDSVVATIAGGRIAVMPPWGAVLGDAGRGPKSWRTCRS